MTMLVEMPNIDRLQITRRSLKSTLDARYKELEDALQKAHRIRYRYFRIRRAYHFVDRELAKIDGRFHVIESTASGKSTKTKKQKSIEDLNKEQLTELITKLEMLKEREEG